MSVAVRLHHRGQARTLPRTEETHPSPRPSTMRSLSRSRPHAVRPRSAACPPQSALLVSGDSDFQHALRPGTLGADLTDQTGAVSWLRVAQYASKLHPVAEVVTWQARARQYGSSSASGVHRRLVLSKGGAVGSFVFVCYYCRASWTKTVSLQFYTLTCWCERAGFLGKHGGASLPCVDCCSMLAAAGTHRAPSGRRPGRARRGRPRGPGPPAPLRAAGERVCGGGGGEDARGVGGGGDGGADAAGGARAGAAGQGRADA